MPSYVDSREPPLLDIMVSLPMLLCESYSPSACSSLPLSPPVRRLPFSVVLSRPPRWIRARFGCLRPFLESFLFSHDAKLKPSSRHETWFCEPLGPVVMALDAIARSHPNQKPPRSRVGRTEALTAEELLGSHFGPIDITESLRLCRCPAAVPPV